MGRFDFDVMWEGLIARIASFSGLQGYFFLPLIWCNHRRQMLIVGNIFILMCYSRFGSGISCFFSSYLLFTNFPFNYGEWWVRSDCVGNWCIRKNLKSVSFTHL